MDIVFHFYRMRKLWSVQQCTYSLHFGMVKSDMFYVIWILITLKMLSIIKWRVHTHTPFKEKKNKWENNEINRAFNTKYIIWSKIKLRIFVKFHDGINILFKRIILWIKTNIQLPGKRSTSTNAKSIKNKKNSGCL